MRRKVCGALLAVSLLGASLTPAAGAAITQSSNNGHPNTNPAGMCPTGQN